MAFGFPATVVTTTEVLWEISAFTVVWSTSSTRIPINSVKALLVPEPSSLEMTEIGLALAPPSAPSSLPPLPQAARENTITRAKMTVTIFFSLLFICFYLLHTVHRFIRCVSSYSFSLQPEYTMPMLSLKPQKC